MRWLRSVIFLASLPVTALVLALVGWPLVFLGRDKAMRVTKLWARIALWSAKYIAGTGYRLENHENMPTGGAIVASNHQSMWETIALYALLPNPVIIFKKELLRVPVYGWWARATGNIIIDRDGGAKSLRKVMNQAKERIAEGAQVIVFPEGTRIPVGKTGKYQSGVAGVYKFTAARCYLVAHNSGCFWRRPGVIKIPGEITLRFLPPIEPGLDAKTFLAQLQAQIDGARPDLQIARRGDQENI